MIKSIVIDDAQLYGSACLVNVPLVNDVQKVQRLFGEQAYKGLATFGEFEEMANACLLG